MGLYISINKGIIFFNKQFSIKKWSMSHSETFSLIEGSFKADEAREILLNIISAKIQFHQMKNISSKERLGKQDDKSLKRIQELKVSMEKVLELITDSKKNDSSVVISSTINIQKDNT